MNDTVSAPLRLQWLADRQRRPRALWLRPGPDAASALASLLGLDDWKALCARTPCYLDSHDDDALAPELRAALRADGLKVLPAGQPLLAAQQFVAADSGDWVAGDWYLQPPALPNAGQAASRTRALQLVQLVSADADTRDIEAVLRQDATLSYHLLRLVNSLAMGGQREITSFAQAILILGRQQLRRWLNLMLFAARDDDPRSPMLMAHVAVRARTLELLEQARGGDRLAQEQAFMTGMFSLLGVLFGLPLTDVLRPLNLGDALTAALLRHEGELGDLLRLVQAAEDLRWDELGTQLAALAIPAGDFNRIQVGALRWMLDVTRDS